jgi:hypothetical protein
MRRLIPSNVQAMLTSTAGHLIISSGAAWFVSRVTRARDDGVAGHPPADLSRFATVSRLSPVTSPPVASIG